MPNMRLLTLAAPIHVGGAKRTPCGAPARQRLSHAPYMAYLIPAGISAPQAHFLEAVRPGDLILLAFTIPLVGNPSESPPGPASSGRTICQRESLLRI
jgi:hypothetical protein